MQMLIGLERKFVFVANTKTASTSIESVLKPHADIQHAGNPERKHVPLRRAFNLYPEVFGTGREKAGDYFKFGVMRDPLDWIGSWFRYRKGNKVDAPLPADMEFAEFWALADWNIRRRDGTRFLQRHMFSDVQGGLLADVIIPFDQLNSLFTEICDAFGFESKLPRENVSHVSELSVPKSLEEELREFYAPDYALFGQLDTINVRGMEKLRNLVAQG